MFFKTAQNYYIKKILLFSLFIFCFEIIIPHKILAYQKNEQKSSGPSIVFIKYPSNNEIQTIPQQKNDYKKKDDSPYYTIYITITAYSSTVDQCDNDPFTAASGKQVYWGMLASNAFPFGTKIQIPGFEKTLFSVEDRMNARYYHHLDIWMPTREAAKNWGVQYLPVKIYK